MVTKRQRNASERNWTIFRLRGAKSIFVTLIRIGGDKETKLALEGLNLCGKILTLMRKGGSDGR